MSRTCLRSMYDRCARHRDAGWRVSRLIDRNTENYRAPRKAQTYSTAADNQQAVHDTRVPRRTRDGGGQKSSRPFDWVGIRRRRALISLCASYRGLPSHRRQWHRQRSDARHGTGKDTVRHPGLGGLSDRDIETYGGAMLIQFAEDDKNAVRLRVEEQRRQPDPHHRAPACREWRKVDSR